MLEKYNKILITEKINKIHYKSVNNSILENN